MCSAFSRHFRPGLEFIRVSRDAGNDAECGDYPKVADLLGLACHPCIHGYSTYKQDHISTVCKCVYICIQVRSISNGCKIKN
jgi:hypothetical protein